MSFTIWFIPLRFYAVAFLLLGTVYGSVAVGPLTPAHYGPLEGGVDFIVDVGDGPEPLNESDLEELIHDEVNAQRAAHGAHNLSHNSQVREVARYHSDHMAEQNYYAHTAPNGETVGDRFARHGLICEAGENLVKMWYATPVETENGTVTHTSMQELAEGIVSQWMNSPPHRESLLDLRWEVEGIGVSITEEDGETVVYVTQNFC